MLQIENFANIFVKQKLNILFIMSINYKIVTKCLSTFHID